MLSPHLVRQVEQHADRLADELVEELLRNSRTPTFRRLDREALHDQLSAVYQHLGQWLGSRSEADVHTTFVARGRDRYEEHVPLEELVYMLILVKRQLRERTRQVSGLSSAAEIHSDMEIDGMIGTFFDRVLYAMVSGYEEARRDAGHPHQVRETTLLGEGKPSHLTWVP